MWSCSIILLLFYCYIYSQTVITKQDYIEAIKIAEAQSWDEYQNAIKKWQQSDPAVRDDNPPKPGYYPSRFSALLYQVTGERKYAEHTRDVLLNMTSGDAYYIVVALNQIKTSGVISKNDLAIIEPKILASADRAMCPGVSAPEPQASTRSTRKCAAEPRTSCSSSTSGKRVAPRCSAWRSACPE